jgi:catechol 2,3-dioxygenase-like lactoylglutathione lyase family enzyme
MLIVRNAFSGFSVDDLDTAEAFYRDSLGLTVRRTPVGLELDVTGGSAVFVYPKGTAHSPASFTILNLVVPDVGAAATVLSDRGVQLLRYPGSGQDDDGIMRSAGTGQGPTIAWFTDPAGNVLSLIEE